VSCLEENDASLLITIHSNDYRYHLHPQLRRIHRLLPSSCLYSLTLRSSSSIKPSGITPYQNYASTEDERGGTCVFDGLYNYLTCGLNDGEGGRR
jgi:hypothetical protein